MKHIILLVSLILLSITAFRDSYREQTNLADPVNPLSLTCPEYLPTEHIINANPDFAKPDPGLNNIDQNWYSAAVDNIMKEEYNITYSEDLKSYQSPNRANNIRFTYQNNGFTAKTMQTKIPLFDVNAMTLREEDKKYKTIEDWCVVFGVKNYELGIKNEKFSSSGNNASIENENIRIDYTNTKEGMRQDFIIKEKPSGDDELQLIMNVSTKLNMNVSKDAVTFRSKKDGSDKMNYSSLKAWDANGKILKAYFDKQNDKQFSIRIIDRDAQYPVTIDPLSSTPDWEVDIGFDYFSCTVATAGDVNGDGYSDVIIGDNSFDSYRGKAFVYHGSVLGISLLPDWTAAGDQANSRFGFSVSEAGDVNNDGYSDVIISAPYHSQDQFEEGRVYVYYGSPTGILLSPAWISNGESVAAYYGESVSGAGDVNGDNFSDVIIGTYRQFPQGKVYVFHGSPLGLPPSPNWIAEGDTAWFGYSVSNAGDVNNDGFSDVIVGNFSAHGKAFVYHGSSSGLSNSPEWMNEGNFYDYTLGWRVSSAGDVNGDGYSDVIVMSSVTAKINLFSGSPSGVEDSADWTLDLPGYTSFWSVSTAGDVNADSYSDIIIGSDEGRAYIYEGSSSGLSDVPAWQINKGGDFRSVSTAGDVNDDGFSDVILGNYGFGKAYAYYGSVVLAPLYPDWHYGEPGRRYAVSPAGDVNSDGYDDVIVGDTIQNKAYLFYGSSSGIHMTYDWVGTGTGTVRFGSSVSSAGDVNSDGFYDIVISDPEFPNQNGSVGAVFVYNGSNTGLPSISSSVIPSVALTGNFGYYVKCAGDVNNDGFSDILIAANQIYNSHDIAAYVFGGSASGISSANLLWTASMPENATVNAFGSNMSPAGDVNGDNYDDIIIAAFEWDDWINSGLVFGYFGRPGKPMYEPPDWSVQGYSAFAHDISNAGDINSDGYDDVIVSAMRADEDNGRIYLFNGSQTGLSSLPDWSFTGYWHGLYSISSAGDFNCDGFNDIIAGDMMGQPGTHLYFGSPNGLSSSDDISYFPPGGNIAGNGDFNGDGCSDFLTAYSHNYYVGSVGGFYGRKNSLVQKPRMISKILGEEHCNSILLRSAAGKPQAGFKIDLLITGANADSVELTTDALGKATYCYFGTAAGVDKLIATAGSIADTVLITWDYPNPVELLSFSYAVNNKDITLSWSTSAELNNSGFEIQRSVENSKLKVERRDAKRETLDEWNKIGFINGSGTVSELVNYTFTDKNLSTGKYKYRLKQIDFNGNFEYFKLAEEVSIGIPDKFYLSQNYPNPFNPVTNLEFGIAKLGFVSLKIYDVLGRELVTLVNEIKEPGYYKIKFNAADLASGVYFYRMTADDFVAVKKLVVMK